MGRTIEDAKINGIMIIGGLNGFEAALKMKEERQRFSAFRIPIICVPASIDNNLPLTELSIGTDTALNTNVRVLNQISSPPPLPAVASSRKQWAATVATWLS